VVEAVERLVNLALFLAAAREPVSARNIQDSVDGYNADQDAVSFLRMFERDKDALRDAGLVIVTTPDGSRYQLDKPATFATSVDLTSQEAAAVRAVGTAMLADPSFPFADDLRLALAKIASSLDASEVSASSRLVDEEPRRQGENVALLSQANPRVTFTYTNSHGQTAPHDVEPFGLFLHDGRWYLVGRDTRLDELRTYTVSRASDILIDPSRPKSPDFERPADFDVRAFSRLPFQYGPTDAEFEAVVHFGPDASWRAEALTGGAGTLAKIGDALTWTISARDASRLLRFVVENGPGIELVAPAKLAARLRADLREVARVHES
jgi:proteasome accessory factor B